MVESRKDDCYNVLKGIAIVMMVAFHAAAPACISRVGNCFHMAVFFILAGWFFDFRHSESFSAWISYLHKRIVRLWWPAVFWGGVFMVFHNQLLDSRLIHDLPFFYGDVPSDYQFEHWTMGHQMLQLVQLPFLLGDFSKLAGAFWFLKALLIASVLYAFISFLFRHHKSVGLIFQAVFAVALLLFGRYVYVPYLGALIGGGSMMTAYGLIHLGVIMRYFNLNLLALEKKRVIGIGAVSLVLLVIFSRLGTVSLALNRFPNAFFLYSCSALGWLFLLALSSVMGGPLKAVLAYLGSHTMPIVLLHLLAFKLVSFLGVMKEGLPLSRIADFSVTFTTGLWWIPYTIVGICLPLALDAVYRSICMFSSSINRSTNI